MGRLKGEVRQLKGKEYVVVSDFDGTITLEDTNNLLFLICGNAENEKIEADYYAGAVSNREGMARHFEVMPLTLDGYYAFLDAEIHIDPGFDAFLEELRRQEIPFFIVSAGFRQGILRILGEERVRGVEILANDLLGEPYLKPRFTMDPACEKPIGPCGNCKRACLAAIREKTKRKIVYIGDGLTDRCAIEGADLLFAKDALADYCRAYDVAYVPFESFADVRDYLWGEQGGRL